MATVRTKFVDRELKAIAGSSQAIRKQLFEALEGMEDSPSSFPLLDDVPEQLAERDDISFHKVKLTNRKHDYRLVFVLRKLPEGGEHVDVLLAFPRKKDYQIDWDWVAGLCEEQ